jgi:hypothetical protein
MPLTPKGEEIKQALTEEYGEKKGEQVLYAGKNAGTFKGIDAPLDIKDDRGEYAEMLKPFHRSNDVHHVKVQDAVLNWGGGQNNNTILPGGEGDTPSMPEGAAEATGVDGK